MPTLPLASTTGRAVCRALARCRQGLIAVQTAILLVVLLGFVSIGTDIGAMLWQRRAMQSAADSAALGAAYAATVGNPPNFAIEGKSISASYGFLDGAASTAVKVNNPPTLGTFRGNTGAIEVLITRPYASMLASLFYTGDFPIAARSVALIGQLSDTCMLILDPTAQDVISMNGTTNLTLSSCSLFVESSSSTAISMVGNSNITADDVKIVGGDKLNGAATITATKGVQTNVSPVADPYASLAVPSFSGCAQTNYSLNSTGTLSPGVYCGGMQFKSKAVATLKTGTYILDGGNFSASSGAAIAGTDVAIVLTSSSSASNIGTVSINSGSTITLSAPTTGSMAGVAFYQDRRAPTSGTDSFSGGSSQSLTGAVYLPQQKITYGGSASASTGCIQIIVRAISLGGNSNLALNCTGIPVRSIGSVAAKLVE
jgi:hypothetical protein